MAQTFIPDSAKPALAYAFGGPLCQAAFKQQPEDFIVNEVLPFVADGDGPHWLVRIEKRDLNTLDMLDAVARSLNVPRRAIGYCGLKDRFAITRQYITIPRDKVAEEVLADAAGDGWLALEFTPHRRKLRVGSHRLNSFEIALRDIPQEAFIREALEERLMLIKEQGVPNYFGPQRFGHEGSNLRKAHQLFKHQRKLPRQQHRFAVSAARAFLFNAVVDYRVAHGNWRQLVNGEAVNLDGRSSWFAFEKLSDDDGARFDAFDLHPSGPMCGAGDSPATGEALAIETDALCDHQKFVAGLAELGLKHERRALRQQVKDLDWQFDGDDLKLSFALNKGGFATSVLREIVFSDGLLL